MQKNADKKQQNFIFQKKEIIIYNDILPTEITINNNQINANNFPFMGKLLYTSQYNINIIKRILIVGKGEIK